MLSVGNTKSDNFFKSIYSNKPIWVFLQIPSAVAAIYLLQNPVIIITNSILYVTSNPVSLRILLSIFEGIFFLFHAISLLFLLAFPLIPKALYRFRNGIFTLTLLSFIPHSWTLSNPILVHPFQNTILNFLLYAIPCVTIGLNIHKFATEKALEVHP